MSDEEKMEIIKLHHLEGVSQCELASPNELRETKSSGSRSE